MLALLRWAAAAACAASLGACTRVDTGPAGSSRHAYTIPHVLRVSTVEDIGGLNPHLNNQVAVSYLSQLTMAWLVRVDRLNRLMPELATSVPTQANGGISADGRTITFHLRRGVVWSDGAPFDARDVMFSTQTVLDPRTNEGSRYGFDVIDRYAAPDRYTVTVRLKRPYAPFLMQYFNSGGVMCILPAHLLGRLPTINDAPYNALPVGIGPFRYVRWKRGDAVELEANPRYFRGRPKLDRIVYKIIPDRNTLFAQMRSHELDLWPVSANSYDGRLRDSPGVRVLHDPSFTLPYLDINAMPGHAGADAAVRRALRLGIDRREIDRTVEGGLSAPSDAFYPPAHPMHVGQHFTEYDPARARRLLDAAGWRVGTDGVRARGGRRLVLEAVTEPGARNVDQMYEIIRADLHALGIGMTIRHYPASLLFGSLSGGGILASGRFDFGYVSQGLDALGDLSVNFSCAQSPPSGYNFGRFCNAPLDAAFAAFNATYDPAGRKRLAAGVQRRLDAGLPAIVMGSNQDVFAVNSDLRGFAPNGTTYFDNFMNVDI